MRPIFLAFLLTASFTSWADNTILNAPSPSDVQAGIPAKPPVYQNEIPVTNGTPVQADDKLTDSSDKASSPNNRYFAAFDVQNDPVVFWKHNLRRGVLVVARMTDDSSTVDDPPELIRHYVRYEFPRFGAQLGWSPDSEYVVLTTTDPGGHSPWHWLTLIYSVRAKTLRCLDPVSGDVIAPDFKFVAPHTVQVQVAPASRDFAHPLTINVDLEKKFAVMPRIGVRSEGTRVHVAP